jgi:hypothetical protein
MRDLFDAYDDPPAQHHSPTSVAAAEAIKPKAETLRRKVYDAIRDSQDGLTDEEVQDILNMGGSTQRPRRRELEKSLHIRDSQRKRKTRAGVLAVVWVVNK